MKRVIALTLMLTLVLSSIGVLAVEIEPKSLTSNSVRSVLSFNGNTAYCELICEGKTGTTSINGVLTLQMLNDSGTYTVVEQWTPSATGRLLTFSGTAGVVSGKNYRLVATAVFFTDQGNESKQSSVTKRCP